MVLLQFYASELYRGAVCMGGTCFVYKSNRTGALYSNKELSFYDSKRHDDFLFFISERAKKNWQFVLMNQFDEQRKESSYIVLFFRNRKNVGVKFLPSE